MSKLFSPFTLRGLTLKNRTVIAPMCQYSAVDGMPNDWHLVHLGRFAMGGFGLVILEVTAVTPEGRISYADLGLWDDAQIPAFKRITQFLREHGAASGIQIGHAGRKASASVPWRGQGTVTDADINEPGFARWQTEGPSAVAHSNSYAAPKALSLAEMDALKTAFVETTRRSLEAGFDTIEVHAAHGYLLNQYLSPLANHRTDEYGGSLENRMRYPLEVISAIRAAWPEDKPLLVRISASDNHPQGWTIEDSIVFAKELKAIGVDNIHCSSGGFDGAVMVPKALYQVSLSEAVRKGADVSTMAVGLITEALEAEAIIANGEADLVALARGALDDPNWAVHAQHELDNAPEVYGSWPIQAGYAVRAKDRTLLQRQPTA